MSKQMEGDNPHRRKLAQKARSEGRQPSESGATLGSTKQPNQASHGQRQGPPPVGAHKPAAGSQSRQTRPSPSPSWPRPDPELTGTAPPPEPLVMRYREVVGEVGRRIGVGFEEAKSAAEATVTVLARALNATDRERFLGKVPAELHEDYAVNVPYPPRGLQGFVEEVGRISHRTPDVARYQAQTVISVLSEQDDGLVESLYLPPDLRDLVEPPPQPGGGLVDSSGGPSPLDDGELRAALGRLPYWSGNRRALTRTITLPAANLDRVLAQIESVRRDLGRGPRVTRADRDNATLVVRTTSVDAVTAADVELAHRLDDAIDAAGAGIA
ncbi:DUF2267 domain-containing protein [Rugosimonospora africana]|uniref:Uncharacterized protein n=1 Tax=Rugosimonospora africana TaxID=556532 RepID=A0A8J3QNL5_9ACTN|nr:DUF2267 domain-containing protein [Rugosimonospora africana]GIH13399.1 hypothetical protein Raf01_15710 [Rugosimonospora africana]